MIKKQNEEKILKKRGRKPNLNSPSKQYFGEIQEQAIRQYLLSTSATEKNHLFKTIIELCLRRLVPGVMKMPKFQTITSSILKTMGLTKEELEEDAYYHVLFNLEKFDPNRIGKNGQPVKAFSYYGTCVKNYILGIKQEADKRISKHGGMIDIADIIERVADKSESNKGFEDVKKNLLIELDKSLNTKKLNKNDVIVANTVKYMLTNWHKLEFQSKNEFVRLICYYTQLKPTVIAQSLKKLREVVYDPVRNKL